jgi:hypothetical protein
VCPEGGSCKNKTELTFSSVEIMPGYWQVKQWFQLGKHGLSREDLNFEQCKNELHCPGGDFSKLTFELANDATFSKSFAGCEEGHFGVLCYSCIPGNHHILMLRSI